MVVKNPLRRVFLWFLRDQVETISRDYEDFYLKIRTIGCNVSLFLVK